MFTCRIPIYPSLLLLAPHVAGPHLEGAGPQGIRNCPILRIEIIELIIILRFAREKVAGNWVRSVIPESWSELNSAWGLKLQVIHIPVIISLCMVIHPCIFFALCRLYLTGEAHVRESTFYDFIKSSKSVNCCTSLVAKNEPLALNITLAHSNCGIPK